MERLKESGIEPTTFGLISDHLSPEVVVAPVGLQAAPESLRAALPAKKKRLEGGKRSIAGTPPVYKTIMEPKWSKNICERVLLAGFTLCFILVTKPTSAIDIHADPEVMIQNGTTGVLRCTFKSNEVVSSSTSVTWSFQSSQPDSQFSKAPYVIFYFSNGKGFPGHDEFKDRVQFIGDINKRDVSIQLSPAQFSDNGTFFCDVKNPPDVTGTPARTELRVVLKESLPQSNTAVIVGAVCGALFLLVVIAVVACVAMRVLHNRHEYEGTMAAFQLLFPMLFPLMVGCVAASVHPPRHLPSCQVVQMDVFCSDLSLRSAPQDLPHGVQMLDLSRNQVQNLTEETLAYHTGFHRLNLHSNKIHFIQPGLFKDMTDLKVLDLSRNHLNVFALSKINIGPLTAVESLDLSSNGLYTGMSDYFLAESPLLGNLSLNSNSITKIAQNTFSRSLSLRKISLHNNVILEIEDGAFDSLDHLTELDLSKNSITCITDFNLSNLEKLNLSKNSIELFQSTTSTNKYKLLYLDLSENKMSYFPLLPVYNILQYLDISRNHLQSINVTGNPEKKVYFYYLRYLDMSYNQLRSIPQSFFYCMGSLEVLNVSNNCISSFSITDKHLLRTVKIIDLSYNSLQTLTFEENTLPLLEELFLQGNDLTILDHQIFQRLPSITLLQLHQNNLKACALDQNHQDPPNCVDFSSIPNLQSLYLSENNLRTLPANSFSNTPLKLLDLSLNLGLDLDKDSLSGLEHSLVHLLLRENNISSLNIDLSSLRSLKHIDLSTNHLTTLPTWNKESSIESLNLQNNNLVTLEYNTMLALEHTLKTLYMGSNPLSCCSSLGFLHMVKHSTVVIPDIETVTCVHEEYSEPVNIKKVTQEMCHRPGIQNSIIGVVLAALFVLITLGLLVKCCHSRKRKHNRSFSA
ncbi:hypothetical protein L3Q82_006609 [Scortum barcoo]|uniref:Uncharacterized protein n=1 Tax=Scortum barcoo TaxID=214431 RepID=A0ACB8WZQ3_9TELE|nr:hypothetical protein L3Q82_006609 [Scortum barcoo]